jgi:nitrite reductase/ring-hydroxylating ferredoxin subunit
VFVVRKGDSLHAYRDICPHYGDTSLPWKKDEYLDGQTQHIVCAAHGALFDIATGECLSGPCLGDALAPVVIKVDDKGDILARLDEK